MSLSTESCLGLKEEYWTNNIEEILKLIELETFERPSEKQELREYYLAKQRTRDILKEWELRANKKPKTKYLNSIQKRVAISDITQDMADKEEEWGILYHDYLQDLK
jgi:hypothetical protein